jgi:hypothetical protein
MKFGGEVGQQKSAGRFRRSAQLFDDDVFVDLTRRVNNKSFGKRETRRFACSCRPNLALRRQRQASCRAIDEPDAESNRCRRELRGSIGLLTWTLPAGAGPGGDRHDRRKQLHLSAKGFGRKGTFPSRPKRRISDEPPAELRRAGTRGTLERAHPPPRRQDAQPRLCGPQGAVRAPPAQDQDRFCKALRPVRRRSQQRRNRQARRRFPRSAERATSCISPTCSAPPRSSGGSASSRRGASRLPSACNASFPGIASSMPSRPRRRNQSRSAPSRRSLCEWTARSPGTIAIALSWSTARTSRRCIIFAAPLPGSVGLPTRRPRCIGPGWNARAGRYSSSTCRVSAAA